MGKISVAAFRPLPEKEAQLLAVLRDRVPLLRRLGLATDREPILIRSRDGVIVQISEWSSEDAIERAHSTPEVLELWRRFDACCTYVKLDALPEAHENFATFEPLES